MVSVAAIEYTPLERMLSDGSYHSGQTLADALGVSRTAVWKQLNQLKKLGVNVQSDNTLGYRIVGGLSLLNVAVINGYLRDGMQVDCSIQRQVTSTNDVLRDLFSIENASSRLNQSCYVLAEHQTSGRGRQGKSWCMPFGSGLCFSTNWELRQGVRQAQGLSLVIGVAIADALVGLGLDDIALKWPNDIWLKGKKLGGILVELSGDVMSHAQAIIGVGLNYALPPPDVWLEREQIIELAARINDLASSGVTVSRNELMAALIASLEKAEHQFLELGFEAFQARWQAYDGLYDCPVSIAVSDGVSNRESNGISNDKDKKKELYGIAQGIDKNGGIRVLLDGGASQVFYGGEVSLRQVDLRDVGFRNAGVEKNEAGE